MKRFTAAVFVTVLFVFPLAFGVFPVFSQQMAVIDYPVAVILHPEMTNFRFSLGRFEKAPLMLSEKDYQDWIAKVTVDVVALHKKNASELSRLKGLVERLEKNLLSLRQRHFETIQSLADSFEKLRSSGRESDRVLLERTKHAEKMKSYEEKYNADSEKVETELKAALEKLQEIEEKIQAPRYTTTQETRQMFARIEQDILAAANQIMKARGTSVLLNSAGMGWPAPSEPVTRMDPSLIAQSSDLELQMYKMFLHSDPRPEPQDSPNPEYMRAMESVVQIQKAGQVRKALQARSALRLPEPDFVPRILSGGLPITIDTVNQVLFNYGVSELHRGIVAQALREMNIL